MQNDKVRNLVIVIAVIICLALLGPYLGFRFFNPNIPKPLGSTKEIPVPDLKDNSSEDEGIEPTDGKTPHGLDDIEKLLK